MQRCLDVHSGLWTFIAFCHTFKRGQWVVVFVLRGMCLNYSTYQESKFSQNYSLSQVYICALKDVVHVWLLGISGCLYWHQNCNKGNKPFPPTNQRSIFATMVDTKDNTREKMGRKASIPIHIGQQCPHGRHANTSTASLMGRKTVRGTCLDNGERTTMPK